MEDTTLQEARALAQEHLNAAQDMLHALCNGERRWVMSIPARPDYDPDIIFGKALTSLSALIAVNERLEAEAKELRAQVELSHHFKVGDKAIIRTGAHRGTTATIVECYLLPPRYLVVADDGVEEWMNAHWIEPLPPAVERADLSELVERSKNHAVNGNGD